VHECDGFREALNLSYGLPDGQITSPLLASGLWDVQPLSKKYFCFSEMQIRLYDLPSHPERGALRNVNNAGRAAVAADALVDERR
jgi:hypothetical protein